MKGQDHMAKRPVRRGLQGAKGNTGAIGKTGRSGTQGAIGLKGATGRTGQAGPKGDTGTTGKRGRTGVPADREPKPTSLYTQIARIYEALDIQLKRTAQIQAELNGLKSKIQQMADASH
jgi:hypothetical protein